MQETLALLHPNDSATVYLKNGGFDVHSIVFSICIMTSNMPIFELNRQKIILLVNPTKQFFFIILKFHISVKFKIGEDSGLHAFSEELEFDRIFFFLFTNISTNLNAFNKKWFAL